MTKIAIIGATGAVGREMIADLEDSAIQNIELKLFASPRSAGEMLSFRGKGLEVKAYNLNELKGVSYCLLSAGGGFSKQHAPQLAELGITVIDNSSAWRMTEGVPLVVPEVNGSVLTGLKPGSIIANPNCSTIQMVLPLKALDEKFGIEHVQVSTYQSVSGTGQKGIKELGQQIEATLKFSDLKPQVYPQTIAFNVIPSIDVMDSQGHCFEEEKMMRETRKILGRPDLEVLATTVRVPVYHGHSEAVSVRCRIAASREQFREALASFPGLSLTESDEPSELPTPRTIAGERGVYVARVRTPLEQERSHWVQLWIVADNLKKGAATNAVQILEGIL